jgi:chromosome segregation ATPase
MPLGHDGAAPEEDLASTLAARIAAIEEVVRTTTEVVDEKTLKELRRTVEALAKRDPKFEERVGNRVDVLADRIEHVAKTVSTSSGALAAKDGEIAQLRRELEGSLQRINGAIAAAGRGTDPAELAEVRRRLDELTKVARERTPRGLEHRLDQVEAKFALVAQRVDSVSSTISTTAAGLAGRDGEINALRRTFETESDRVGAELAELRRGNDPTAVVDLRQALKEFADETSRRQHAIHNQIGQAGAKVDALAEKVEALGTALDSTTSRVAGTEQDLSAFRAYFEDAGGKLSALLAEHNRSLAALSTRTTMLEQADADTARADEERLLEVDARLDRAAERLVGLEQSRDEAAQFLDRKLSTIVDTVHELAAQVEPLSAEVAATKERMDARESAVEALEGRFQDATSRVDALVAELARALAELPDPDSVEQALVARIDVVSERTALAYDELAQVKESVSEGLEASAAASSDLARLRAEHREALDELTGYLGSLTASVESTASGISTLDEELSAIRSRTSVLEEAVTETSSAAARASGTEEEVSALRDYVEKAGSRLNSLVAENRRSVAALETRTASLEESDGEAASRLDEQVSAALERIDELRAELDPLLARDNDELAGRVDELVAKLGAAEDDRAENAGDIARVAAIVEVERAAVRRRLDALADTLEKTSSAPDDGELSGRLAALGARVEALDAERASSQAQFDAIAKALASIPQRSTLEQRLDDLSRRLDEVEERGAAVATKVSHASTLLPTALRSLEARLDEVSPGSRAPVREPDAAGEPPASVDEDTETAPADESVDHVTASVVHLRASDP